MRKKIWIISGAVVAILVLSQIWPLNDRDVAVLKEMGRASNLDKLCPDQFVISPANEEQMSAMFWAILPQWGKAMIASSSYHTEMHKQHSWSSKTFCSSMKTMYSKDWGQIPIHLVRVKN